MRLFFDAPLGRNSHYVKRSKDSFKEKIDTVIDVYCEKRNCAVKGHASNTPVRAKGTVADIYIYMV